MKGILAFSVAIGVEASGFAVNIGIMESEDSFGIGDMTGIITVYKSLMIVVLFGESK